MAENLKKSVKKSKTGDLETRQSNPGLTCFFSMFRKIFFQKILWGIDRKKYFEQLLQL